jgi:hypothetical protein
MASVAAKRAARLLPPKRRSSVCLDAKGGASADFDDNTKSGGDNLGVIDRVTAITVKPRMVSACDNPRHIFRLDTNAKRTSIRKSNDVVSAVSIWQTAADGHGAAFSTSADRRSVVWYA